MKTTEPFTRDNWRKPRAQPTPKSRNLWRAIAEDDDAVKLIFDHVRNLGICAAVFAAAVWQFHHVDNEFFIARAAGYVAFGFLALIGVWLFFVNQAHGFRKLLEAGIRRETALHIGQLYNLGAVTLLVSVASR